MKANQGKMNIRRKSVLEREELEAREKLMAYKLKMMEGDKKMVAL